MDQQHLQQWIGRREQRADRISQSTVAAMAATLDRDRFDVRAGVDVPPLWHWAFFTPLTPAREIGPDGHAKRGDFLPPVSLPRRMWAGGRLVFHHPLRVGEEITRTSRIANVDTKEGRTGPLVFVTVHHEIANASGVAITEEHDIVYREDPRPDAAPAPLQPAPEGAAFTREITPDPVLLFRYSALTFNGHRIHYDRPYVTEVEGYPGLVVHGPLIATLLLELLTVTLPEERVQRFSFKAVRPIFDLHRFNVCGRREGERDVVLWARDHEGALAMRANAELA